MSIENQGGYNFVLGSVATTTIIPSTDEDFIVKDMFVSEIGYKILSISSNFKNWFLEKKENNCFFF